MTQDEEFELWVEAARSVELMLETWSDLRPSEALVVDLYNPAPDLQRRALRWSHEFRTGELPELLAFGAGLVEAELEASAEDRPDVVAKALNERRFLLGDRILHWAVPWLEAAGPTAEGPLHVLLALGDLHRPEPDLTGNEGLTAPGEDRFGSLGPAPLSSLLCGGVVFESMAVSWGSTRSALREGVLPSMAVSWLDRQADRWEEIRAGHPGSAALWRDLGARARQWADQG